MNFKELRKSNKLTLAQLGEKVGVSYNAIWLWETGASKPPIDKVSALAKALNVSELVILECFQKRTGKNLPLNYEKLTEKQFDNAIDKAYTSAQNGKTVSLEEAKKELKK